MRALASEKTDRPVTTIMMIAVPTGILSAVG
jgi:hypothetical protein